MALVTLFRACLTHCNALALAGIQYTISNVQSTTAKNSKYSINARKNSKLALRIKNIFLNRRKEWPSGNFVSKQGSVLCRLLELRKRNIRIQFS